MVKDAIESIPAERIPEANQMLSRIDPAAKRLHRNITYAGLGLGTLMFSCSFGYLLVNKDETRQVVYFGAIFGAMLLVASFYAGTTGTPPSFKEFVEAIRNFLRPGGEE